MTGPSREAVERRVTSLNRVMHAHRGRVSVAEVHEDGRVEVRYDGMCTGCTYRPVCSETLVRPALLDLPRVRRVEIHGSRIDDRNQAELVESVRPSG